MIAKLKQLLQFFKDSRDELKKVTWPSRDEVTSFTVVVIVAVCVISIFLWLVDTGIMAIIKVVMK